MKKAVSISEMVKDRFLRAFTLTELLVVIAIMGIIIMFALPGMRGLGRGTSMSAAVVELRTTISLARQWAITHRQRTYVIFPDDTIGVGSPDIAKAYRAYGVFAATNKSGSISGYYVKDWVSLPPGIVFDNDNTRTQTVFLAANQISIPFPKVSLPVTPKTVCAIGFKPDGSTVTGADGYEVFVREGWANFTTNTWVLDYGVTSNGMNRGLEVNGLTGGIRIREY